jgi:chemotaxis protein CheX
MNRHLVDVFETMLAMKAVPLAEGYVPLSGERITGCVAFAGEHINGAVYLHLTLPFAGSIAAVMIGVQPPRLNDVEMNDVVGEVTNMLTGGLKSWLCDSGAECAVSIPAIIRGSAFTIEPTPGVDRQWLVFDCNHQRIVVEIHIKIS